MTKYKLIADDELLTKVKLGNCTAYAVIYRRYFDVLYHYAHQKLSNEQEAEDVTQDVFISLWEKRERIKINGKLIYYLFTCVKNKILNKIAHCAVEDRYNDLNDSAVIIESNTDHLIRHRQLEQLIDRELCKLPPKMRKVFLLSRKEFKTHSQISKELDITEQSVRSHVKNALKILRVKIKVAC